MTKKDLFKIILKLFGLYSIIILVVQLPNISFAIYYNSLDDLDNDLLMLLLLIIPIVTVLTIYILLFKTDILIRLLKLDKGFDNNETFQGKLSGQEIGKIAFVIIAVYMIVNNIGDFITQVVYSFKESISTNNIESLAANPNPYPVNYILMISSALNLIFGFLLLTNYSRLSKWLDRINNKNID
jgi:hypothetical protein